MLDDGTYDAFVIDATATADDGMHLELTILDGEHKGEVVSVATTSTLDELDLLGMPATLTVTDGTPSVRIDT